MSFYLLTVMLAATPFEGVVHFKLKTPFGDGTVKVSVAPLGVRSDGRVKVGQSEWVTHVVVRGDEPNESYLFDVSKNVWTKMDSKATATSGGGQLTAQVLPDQKVAGVLCRHVLMKDARGGEMEYWTTRSLFPDEKQVAMMALAQKTPKDILDVLSQVDAQGLVMKMKSQRKGQVELSMEVVRVEKKKVSSSLLDVTKPVEEDMKKH